MSTINLLLNHYIGEDFNPSRQVSFFVTEECLNDYLKETEDERNVEQFLSTYDSDESETVYDITDQEYEQYLNTKDEEIRTAIFNICKTKRTDKYYRIYNIACTLSDKFRLSRIGLDDGRSCGTGQTAEHITKIIHDMVEKGYLVCAKGSGEDVLVRSINKTEQKKRKIFVT